MGGSGEEAVAMVAANRSPPNDAKGQRRCVQSKLPWGLNRSRGKEEGVEESDVEGKGKRKRKRKSQPRTPKKSPFTNKGASQRNKGNKKSDVIASVGDSFDMIAVAMKDPATTGPKWKESHSEQVRTDNKLDATKGLDEEGQHMQQPAFDLRLEGKVAAEENAQLLAGKQMHPFFANWRETKKLAESQVMKRENRNRSAVHQDGLPGSPIHIFDKLEEVFVELHWKNWTFEDETLHSNSHHAIDDIPSMFGGPVYPLKLDNISHQKMNLDELFGNTVSAATTRASSTLSSGQKFMGDGSSNISLLSRYSNYVSDLDNQQDNSLVKQRLESYNLRCNQFQESSLWTEKYQPERALEVCGNTDSVKFISEWLKSWHEERPRSSRISSGNCSTITDNDDSLSDNESDMDDRYDETSRKNVLLVTGPIGSGKSAAIYSCAKEHGFLVIEVNSSDLRNGASLRQKYRDGLESHGLNRCSFEQPMNRTKNTIPFASPAVIDVDDMDTFDTFHHNTKSSGSVLEAKGRDCQNVKETLLLFEDVDTIFDEDHGFLSAVLQLAEKTKKPIILTSNNKNPILPQLLDRLVVNFTVPTYGELLSHVYMICAAERVHISPKLLEKLISFCLGDIRKTIMLLQFWCQGNNLQIDNGARVINSPLFFEVDAAHLIMPRVIPWGVQCVLSEKIEDEINKTIAALEGSFWLEAIKEQRLNSTDMVDSSKSCSKLTTSKKGRRRAMSKQNSFVLDCTQCSFGVNDLEDFSDAPDPQPAFALGRARRRPYVVLSSQSDDRLSTDGFLPTDIVSVDHNCYFLHDAAVLPAPQTKEVQNQVNPPSSISYQFRRDDTLQDPLESCDLASASHICQSSRLEDVSCVPQSSFISRIDANGVYEDLSLVVSSSQKSVNSADFARPLPPQSGVEVTYVDNAGFGSNTYSSDVHNCEIDLESVFGNEDLVVTHGEGDPETNGYQGMDECSRADFSVLAPVENCSSSQEICSVQESWRKLRSRRDYLKSYINDKQTDACVIVDLSSQLADLISESDILMGHCKPFFSDNLEQPSVPWTEPDDFSWYDHQLEIGSTFAQHGYYLYTNKCATIGSTLGSREDMDLAQEMLASSTNTIAVGKLLNNCNSYVEGALKTKTQHSVRRARELEAELQDAVLSIVPARLSMSLKGDAFHEYVSFMCQISKLESSRLSISRSTSGTKQRRPRPPVHYLNSGQFSLSSDDIELLGKSFCFKEAGS